MFADKSRTRNQAPCLGQFDQARLLAGRGSGGYYDSDVLPILSLQGKPPKTRSSLVAALIPPNRCSGESRSSGRILSRTIAASGLDAAMLVRWALEESYSAAVHSSSAKAASPEEMSD